MKLSNSSPFILLSVVTGGVVAQSSIADAVCSQTLAANYAAPSVADGYVARLVTNGLTKPRGIKFDSQGALLIVESGVGITALNLVDAGRSCLSVSSKRTVIANPDLNHGIEMSTNGSTLYASTSDVLYSWDYSPQQQTNTSEPRTLIDQMAGTDHTTRTLVLSKHVPGMIVVARGSTSNLDLQAEDINSGISQVKAFDLNNMTDTPLTYTRDGILLGWGLRNEVGIAEEPVTGAIYGVENSVDQLERSGQDIHQDNPGEELNFLGYLNGTASPGQGGQGVNYGYPSCFSAWDASTVPDFKGTVGEQFAIGDQNGTLNDTLCASLQAPRLVFQAHMAPLDILFNTEGTAAWVTFHGSWDRTQPVGYKLSVIEFEDGQPLQPSNSTTAAIDIISNADNSACPGSCFRPVGLAWDSQGRLFMSSDATGEIYVVLRADGNSTQSVGSNAIGTIPGQATVPSGSGTGGSAASSTQAGGASIKDMSALALAFSFLTLVL